MFAAGTLRRASLGLISKNPSKNVSADVYQCLDVNRLTKSATPSVRMQIRMNSLIMENAIFSLFNNQHGKESDLSRHGLHHVCTCLVYRKIPVISPGLKQLRKGVWVGLST